MRPLSTLAFALALATLVCGCATTLPERPAAAALYRDLERMVGVSETLGWKVDAVAVENRMDDILLSVCEAPAEDRRELRAWLEARILEMGGPPEKAWRAADRDLDEIDDLLSVSRVELFLVEAMKRVDRDCPFWIEPHADFDGRQLLDNDWVFSTSGGGKAIVKDRGDRTDITGGGGGRFLLGRSVGARWTVFAGIELGSSADFSRNEDGERQSLRFGLDMVMPIVLRYRLVNSWIELQGGALAHTNERDRGENGEWGWNVGFSVGAQSLKERFFLPIAGFTASLEQTIPEGDVPPLTMFKVGFRAGFDIPF